MPKLSRSCKAADMRRTLDPSPRQNVSAKKRLVEAIRSVYAKEGRTIATRKTHKSWERDDFLWEAILLSLATMGNSRGGRLVKDGTLHSHVTYEALSKLRPNKRLSQLEGALQTAKVRMSKKKAGWLLSNFDKMVAGGGPAALKRQLEKCAGRDAKIQFLKTFRGIGNKYARNMMMDVYHPDFRDSIAYDVRLGKVAQELGLTSRDYQEIEDFFLEAAHEAGLNGWHLDRLI